MSDKTSFFYSARDAGELFQTEDEIAGLKVTVMGLGLHGGGAASARFFAEHGADVTVTDMKSEAELKPSVDALSEFPGIRFVLGCHREEDFANADLVIKNPGVKLEGNPYLKLAKRIESDISVFLRLTKAEIIAVTGSKGKSSTASAIHFGLQRSGLRAFLGGNITVSPLSFLKETDESSAVVLELSSWQLADLRGKKLLKPKCAVITPVVPDHQNWYGSMEKYVADKKVIYENMTEREHLVCNFDDDWGKIFARETKASVHWYSQRPFPPEAEIENGAWLAKDGGFVTAAGKTRKLLPAGTAVRGRHMKANLLNAAQVLAILGIGDTEISDALATYPGIPHRLEFFYEADGIKWYNDSAATVPEASAEAVRAFEEPVILLCGGTDKSLDFAPLAEVAGQAKKILLLEGSGTKKLEPLLKARGIDYGGPYANLQALVAAAKACASAGDAVVFSPGCASFELFKNEFDRGNQLKAEVCGGASSANLL